jgi:methyl-accepting chemotaxis protein
MDHLVQRNAANAEETASAAETLREQSQKMDEVVHSLIALVEGERKRERRQEEAPPQAPVRKGAKPRASGKGNGRAAPRALEPPAARRPARPPEESHEGFEDF